MLCNCHKATNAPRPIFFEYLLFESHEHLSPYLSLVLKAKGRELVFFLIQILPTWYL